VGITSEIQGGAGEYQPGAVVAGRYRIVGLLGRGGMGSVYRADDLTLGQPVALKFLPEALAANRERLDRFRAEVRVSRQVSHANVCRVHDIGEADGRVFLSMELVDGGDLSSLLKRVGRLPADRGLEIARQLCAGLAAAHDRGVLHRDLKPANVMIDSEGRVRIADFGLAGIVGGFEGSEIQSGTPAYMAPETLKGEEVTVQSDVYALGLVLYELFTGRRAFSGASVAELAHKHAEEPPTTPSDIVSDLDPQIEGVILQCLEKDPRARPKSALAVAMALPGGDPLAAALAAGETPSPELVAQAGDEGTLKLSTGWWLLASIAGMLVAFIALSAGRHVLFFERLERPPEVQLDRGVETLERLGVEVPRTDRKTGFAVDRVLQREINRNGLTDDEREALISGETSIVRFWVRAAPLDLVAERTSGRVGPTWPPRTTPGELYAVFDSLGRLRLLEVVPEELMTTADGESPGTVADPWAGAFEAAGLDPMVFDEAQPSWSPPRHVDELRGWMRVGDAPGLGVNRVEVGLCAGRVAYLRTGTAFDHAQESSGTTTGSMLAQTLNAALIVIVLIVGGLLARGNLRRGRGDLRGSWRMAGAVFMLGMTAWLVSADHAFGAGDELDLFVLATGDSLFMAGFVWLLYLALEPEVRRHWPKRLISWQRMLSRSSHDPLVGRHVLIGLVLGSWISLLIVLISSVGKIANPEGFDLDSSGIVLLADPWVVVASVLSNLSQAIFGGVFVTVLLLAVRLLVRRTWISVAVSIVIFVAMNVLGSDDPVVDGVVSALVLAVVMVALLRHGLLTLIAMVFVLNLLQAAPPITSLSSWYLPAGLIPLLVVLVLAVVAFSVSIGRQPWFGAD
jgi:serine/threonine-protein kinase